LLAMAILQATAMSAVGSHRQQAGSYTVRVDLEIDRHPDEAHHRAIRRLE